MLQTWLRIGLSAAACLALAGKTLAQHHGDVEVGRTQGGQLGTLGGDEPGVVYPVDPKNPFGLQGWSGDEPGFEALEAPEENLFPLEPGAEVWLEVVALDPAFFVLNPDTFSPIGVGERYRLGDHELHKHVIWYVSSKDGGFDPKQDLWNVTLKLVDLGTTGYADSPNFELAFGRSCTGKERFSLRCTKKGSSLRLYGKIKKGRPDAVLEAVLDGNVGSPFSIEIGENGKGKFTIQGVSAGAHNVEVITCEGLAAKTQCS